MSDVVLAGAKQQFMWIAMGETQREGLCIKCNKPFTITTTLGATTGSDFAKRTCKAHRDKRMAKAGRKGFASLVAKMRA